MFSQKENAEKMTAKMSKEVNNMLEKDFHSIVDTNLRHTISDIHFSHDDNENEELCMNICACCTCMGGVLGILILVGIVGGYLTWIVFAIKALTNLSNDDIKDKCGGSDLWTLLLTIVIYNGLSVLTQLLSTKSSEYNENKVETYQKEVIKFCLGLALLIWCGIELMEPCVQDKLTNNRIYVLLEYWFFFGCAVFALLVCMSCGLITLNAASRKKERESEDSIQRLGV